MLTTSQAAALLGVSRSRVIYLIHLGTLKAEKPGRDWQIDPASVEAYKNSPRKPGRIAKQHDDRSPDRSLSADDKKSADPV